MNTKKLNNVVIPATCVVVAIKSYVKVWFVHSWLEQRPFEHSYSAPIVD